MKMRAPSGRPSSPWSCGAQSGPWQPLSVSLLQTFVPIVTGAMHLSAGSVHSEMHGKGSQQAPQ